MHSDVEGVRVGFWVLLKIGQELLRAEEGERIKSRLHWGFGLEQMHK